MGDDDDPEITGNPASLRWKKILFPITAVLLGLLVAILIAEISFRYIFRNTRIEQFGPMGMLLQIVENVDHRLQPGSAEDINSDGIRSRRESGAFREEDLNIVLLGDSFVYGFGLPDHQSIPAILEKSARSLHPERKINVANFGWPSSSPLLSFRLLRDIGSRYAPDVVILAVDMTDFFDDVIYAHLLERRGVYRLLNTVPATVLIMKSMMAKTESLHGLHERVYRVPARRFFITENPLETVRPYLSYIRSSIDHIAAYCEAQLESEFILVIFPRHYQYDGNESPHNWESDQYEISGKYNLEPFRYFEEVRRDSDFPVYSLLPVFQSTSVFPTCFTDDPHWNADGNRVAAEGILDYLEINGYIRKPVLLP